MKDLDISNIESKPILVSVINQNEYDQLMQHLEKQGYVWPLGGKPTQWKPVGDRLPFGVVIRERHLYLIEAKEIDRKKYTYFPFPDYASKHINPIEDDFVKSDRVAYSIKIRHEVMSLMAREKFVNEKLSKAQDEGWEIAGDILLKNSSGNVCDTWFHIPMKRVVVE